MISKVILQGALMKSSKYCWTSKLLREISLLLDIPDSSWHLRTLGGVFYRSFGRFKPKFVALSLLLLYLNHPYNGEQNTPKSYGIGLSPPVLRKISTVSWLFIWLPQGDKDDFLYGFPKMIKIKFKTNIIKEENLPTHPCQKSWSTLPLLWNKLARIRDIDSYIFILEI